METITIQAVYEKGVLKPTKKLSLPEHSLVELKVKAAPISKQKTAFASLIGVWEHVSGKENLSLEKALARTRKRSNSKVKKLARSLK